MAKKSGILALLTGVAAGAAAVFLSKKENREMVKEEIVKGEKTVKKVVKEVRKNPKAALQKAEKAGIAAVKNAEKATVVLARRAEKVGSTAVNSVVKKVEAQLSKKNHKVVKKFGTSPALKIVGKPKK